MKERRCEGEDGTPVKIVDHRHTERERPVSVKEQGSNTLKEGLTVIPPTQIFDMQNSSPFLISLFPKSQPTPPLSFYFSTLCIPPFVPDPDTLFLSLTIFSIENPFFPFGVWEIS